MLFNSQHFRGRGACWSFGMGLRRLTSNSITHMDLHKPNNKLVSAQLEHFGARMNYGQTQTHKTHQGLDLREATTFPLIVYSVHGYGTTTQRSFCPKVGTPVTLGAHNFACKLPIEMKFKAKLYPSLKAFQCYVAHHLYVRKLRRFPTFSGRESNCQFDARPFFWP